MPKGEGLEAFKKTKWWSVHFELWPQDHFHVAARIRAARVSGLHVKMSPLFFWQCRGERVLV